MHPFRLHLFGIAGLLLGLILAVLLLCAGALAGEADHEADIGPPPAVNAYAALDALPDWSGTWIPDIPDQNRQIKSNPTPWNAVAQKKIDAQFAEMEAGRPQLIFHDCLPENHPSFMLISHNAMEILFTPGRVTMIGEADMYRLRRIYTDGRALPSESELVDSFQGYSVGHWEGDTLVVETVGIYPQAPLAIDEAVGLPNNGGLRTVERIHLAGPDTLHVELEIHAPQILSAPWKTTRVWQRSRERAYEVVEGVCTLGQFRPRVNEAGDHVWEKFELDEYGGVAPSE